MELQALSPYAHITRLCQARLRIIWLLILLLPAGPVPADIVKPALVEISVNTNGTYQVEVRASIEALLTGINARYKNTRDAPNAAAYDELRVLPAAALAEAFKPFHSRFINEVTLLFDAEQVALNISRVDIPEPGYTKVPRISVIYLEGNIARKVDNGRLVLPGQLWR